MRLWFLLFVVLAAGCSETPRCTPGASASCSCTDGRTGAQLCDANGAFGACICAGGGDAGTLADVTSSLDATPRADTPSPPPADPLLGREIVTVFCDSEPWQSGVEVRQTLTQGTTLEVLARMVRDRASPGFQQEGSVLRWTTPYHDIVFVDGDAGRVVVASRCPVRNVGMVRRLDAAVWDVAALIDRARPNTPNTDLHAFACGPRRYFAQSAHVYSRTSLQAWDVSNNAQGTLAVPSMVSQRGTGVTMCTYGEGLPSLGPLRIDGTLVFDFHRLPVNAETCLGFESRDLGTLTNGSHSFQMSRVIFAAPCGRGSGSGTVWFEVAGEGASGPLGATVGAGPQPVITTELFSALNLPGRL